VSQQRSLLGFYSINFVLSYLISVWVRCHSMAGHIRPGGHVTPPKTQGPPLQKTCRSMGVLPVGVGVGVTVGLGVGVWGWCGGRVE